MEIKSNVDRSQKPTWPPGSPCRCKKVVRYIQPEIAKSFKPNLKYEPSPAPVTTDTVYKNSYKDIKANDLIRCRSKPKLPKDSIVSAGDFATDTTNKMSYTPWDGYKRQEKILPRHHCLMGVGPLQEMTTTKHDYTPKYLTDQFGPFKPSGCLGMSDKPMEQKTTTKLSYNWPERFEPVSSFKPEKRYMAPEQKMSEDTTQRQSYQPFSNVKRQKYPWQEKLKYKSPNVPMIGDTIYKNSYLNPGREVEEQCGPNGCYCNIIGECFDAEGNPPKAHEFGICPIGYQPENNAPQAVS